MRHIVIVGASIAGLSAARTLRADGFDGDVTLVGDEPHRPYDRTLLSKDLLRRGCDPVVPELALATEFDDLAVDWRPGRRACGLDAHARCVDVGDGQRLGFDGLVIATGAEPVRLDVLHRASARVLRTYDHATALRASLADAEHVVVVGAGFVGCEVASTHTSDGGAVTLLDAAETPMARVLPSAVGRAFTDLHRAHGVDVRCGTTVRDAQPVGGGIRLDLSDGRHVLADVVVEAVGVRPAVGWLTGAAGVAVGDGILCDACCRTTVPGVVAAGDVAAVWDEAGGRHVRIEHWLHAEQHGQAAARSLLAGDAAVPFVPDPVVWSDQFGHRLQVVGRPAPSDALAHVDGGGIDTAEGFVVATARGEIVTGLIAVDRSRTVRRLRGGLNAGTTLADLDGLIAVAA